MTTVGQIVNVTVSHAAAARAHDRDDAEAGPVGEGKRLAHRFAAAVARAAGTAALT